MNLKLQNPFRGSLDPWPLTKRVWRFLFTAVAMLFMNAHASILKTTVRGSTGLKDPKAVPKEPLRVASILCAASAFFLLFGIGLVFAARYEAIAAFVLSSVCSFAAGWWLRQKVGGPPPRPFGQTRFAQILRRLWQVIRHGAP
jgi:hypothetical protein